MKLITKLSDLETKDPIFERHPATGEYRMVGAGTGGVGVEFKSSGYRYYTAKLEPMTGPDFECYSGMAVAISRDGSDYVTLLSRKGDNPHTFWREVYAGYYFFMVL